MAHLHYFSPCHSVHHLRNLREVSRKLSTKDIQVKIEAEFGFHIVLEHGVRQTDFVKEHGNAIRWLLSTNPFTNFLKDETTLQGIVYEIGPRQTFKTAYCTNALSAFDAAGIKGVARIERTLRCQINVPVDPHKFLEVAGDRMTECIYPDNMQFVEATGREDFFDIDVLGNRENLQNANRELGLAFDDNDLKYYESLFVEKFKRNPTDVELFDLAQSDSEHSRHWFFRGKLIVDGVPRDKSLMDLIRSTQTTSNPNNIIAFSDNSSAIKGFDSVRRFIPEDSAKSSKLQVVNASRHVIYSAETHNFPTAVCPFQGATTGTGGRIRDIQATGRGAHEIAGVAGYSFGNLLIDGYDLPWEERETYPSGFSDPCQIAIEASNGASDYGNKFGEPVVCGFARSFGQRLPNGERCEYVKPIMFSGGVGAIDNGDVRKEPPSEGQYLAKIGGPVYRIGVGGGAASSLSVQGSRESELDYGAVQRGDPEMEQKLHRVVRACIEQKENPILSIHDQGAGGNGNVLKELVEGAGAVIDADKFVLGDPTISSRELWTAEYQENNACTVDPSLADLLIAIGKREKCDVSLVGHVTKEPRVVLTNFKGKDGRYPVDFNTTLLGERAKKVFHLSTSVKSLKPLRLPDSLTVLEALHRVLRLPSVGSKRYLTCKVDRSVTGLVAQQQCVGTLHTPVADVAVVALSHFDTVGAAVAVGEQPIKMLVNTAAGARMTVAETMTNLVFCPITDLKDVKMSGNWMWPAKCDGEGARLVEACEALCESLATLGCAIDGGKDSLSMAAKANGELVKAPGTLVLSAYCSCPDVTKVINPALVGPTEGEPFTSLLYIRMAGSLSHNRLGGSALAQVYKQIGSETPDIADFKSFSKSFSLVQDLIRENLFLSGHDISDGGLLVSLLEMAFAGNRQINVDIDLDRFAISDDQLTAVLFAEEASIVVECRSSNLHAIMDRFADMGTECLAIGTVGNDNGSQANVELSVNGTSILKAPLVELREIWEETGDKLGIYQTTEKCLSQAKKVRREAGIVRYSATFDWNISENALSLKNEKKFKVAIIREEGSNGDREMAAAFALSGFEVYDVTMTDLLGGHSLDPYCGIAFVGGFSYADVLGSAKGWAAAIRYHPRLAEEFERFRLRSDTFSFGVCNGCQLMALLGWIGENDGAPGVFLAENECGRFESNFGPCRIEASKSIMLRGMQGSILGLWSSHGEGRFVYKSSNISDSIENEGLVAVRYVDDKAQPTDQYPWNPNGSSNGVAGLCSKNGRHLALMPHSDRSFLSWQWPDYPKEWQNYQGSIPVSPWIKMFQNAYEWVLEQNA